MTRFVYLDETGTNLKKDPFTITAGLIVHADKQIGKLERGLIKICTELVPEELWMPDNLKKPFFFHASDYINGFGAFKDLKAKNKWDVHKGMEIAESIISLCEDVGVRVVWGLAENKCGKSTEELHINSFGTAVIAIEHYMLSEAHGEVCILVAENHDRHKKKLKQLVIGMKNSGVIEAAGMKGSKIPIRTIKDVVHFVDKTDSYCIQIADTICYIAKKVADSNRHYDDLFWRMEKMGLTT